MSECCVAMGIKAAQKDFLSELHIAVALFPAFGALFWMERLALSPLCV